jgi:hypothetical protein
MSIAKRFSVAPNGSPRSGLPAKCVGHPGKSSTGAGCGRAPGSGMNAATAQAKINTRKLACMCRDLLRASGAQSRRGAGNRNRGEHEDDDADERVGRPRLRNDASLHIEESRRTQHIRNHHERKGK